MSKFLFQNANLSATGVGEMFDIDVLFYDEMGQIFYSPKQPKTVQVYNQTTYAELMNILSVKDDIFLCANGETI